MKRYPMLVAVLILLVAGAAVSEPAMARGGRGGGSHGGGHGYGGRIGVGIALGVPLYGLGYYSAPYYSYPYGYTAPAYSYPPSTYAYPGPEMAPSGGYVEQGRAQAVPAPASTLQQDWFFCPSSNSYYPYVRECASGWQRVPAQPPR